MRLNLFFSKIEGGILKEIMEWCGFRTKVECIRNALFTFHWIMGQIKGGRKIISRKDGELECEMAFPWIINQK